MGIKSMLQRWLGITTNKPKQNAARVYQAPMQYAYQETLQRLPFEKAPIKTQRKKKERDWSHKSMKKSIHAPKTAREMYDACGGYDAFRIITMHPKWYKTEKRRTANNPQFLLRVYNHSVLSSKKKPESKIMHVLSEEHGHEMAAELMEIHIGEITKRRYTNRP